MFAWDNMAIFLYFMKQYTFEERNVHTVTCPKRQILVDCTIITVSHCDAVLTPAHHQSFMHTFRLAIHAEHAILSRWSSYLATTKIVPELLCPHRNADCYWQLPSNELSLLIHHKKYSRQTILCALLFTLVVRSVAEFPFSRRENVCVKKRAYTF